MNERLSFLLLLSVAASASAKLRPFGAAEEEGEGRCDGREIMELAVEWGGSLIVERIVAQVSSPVELMRKRRILNE